MKKKRGSEENNNEKTSQSPKRHHQNQISTVEKSQDLNIPYDLTVEILSKLPAKSLARFQCVSKPWSSLITDSYTAWSLTKPRLLVISHYYSLLKSFWFSSCTYPINTDKTSVPAEKDSYTLVCGLNFHTVFQYTRGLICCLSTSGHRFAINNPTTRQSVLLPKIKSEIKFGFMDGFFGYDPVENQYKVVCMFRGKQKVEDSYHVFTLGDSKKQWRNIQGFGQYISPTMTTRVCINGKIYFRASLGRYDNIPKPNCSRNVLLCFDVRSERFNHIPIPNDQSRVLTLVNYKGKLGCMCYSSDSAEMWIMEDHNEKQEWSKIICSMSRPLLMRLGEGTCCIAGVTLNGEVVIIPKELEFADQSLYAYYYDPKQNKTRRVEYENSIKEEVKSHMKVCILSVPDHVDNLMSLH